MYLQTLTVKKILAKNKNLLTDKTDITDFLLLEIHPRHILSALSVLSARKNSVIKSKVDENL